MGHDRSGDGGFKTAKDAAGGDQAVGGRTGPVDAKFLQRRLAAVADGESEQRDFAALIETDAAGRGFEDLAAGEGDVATVEKFNERFALQFGRLRKLVPPGLTILNNVTGHHGIAAVSECEPGTEFALDAVVSVVAESIAADGDT